MSDQAENDARLRRMIEEDASHNWQLTARGWDASDEPQDLWGLRVPPGPVAALGRGRVMYDLPARTLNAPKGGDLHAGQDGDLTARVLLSGTREYVSYFIQPDDFRDPMRIELGMVQLLG